MEINAARSLRRWTREEHGFAGAEKALFLCCALGIVLLFGALLRGGSETAASDARRTLMTQGAGAGSLGSVVRPLQAAGDIAKPGEGGHPRSTPQPAPQPAPVAVQTGLGQAVDAIAANSPTLAANITALQRDGWTLRYGAAGGGSFTDRNQRTVTLDPSLQASPLLVVQTLAHESGHARYTPDAYTPPDRLTRDQYVTANVWHSLRDEGEATLTNLQVRKELIGAQAGDIGVAGAQSAQYQALFNRWDGTNRDQLRTDMGRIYANGEHPSTDPGSTYWQYYARTFESFYDQNVAGR